MQTKFYLVMATFVALTSFSLSAASPLSLEQRLQQLEQQLETKTRLQSDMSIQLIELQKEVRELRGIIEEHDYKLKQIQDRQRDLYRDIENRLSSLPANSGNSAPATTNRTPATTNRTPATMTPSSSVVSPNVASKVREAVSGNERAEFETAFKHVRNREYTKAIGGFQSFLTKYPSGAYSDNARYWIGQVYFAQSKFDEAEQQFNLMRTEFPNSTKMPSALLKLAEIKVSQKKWEDAKTLYNEVLNNYTGANQQLARKGLLDIKQQGH